jgi:hypothetical protein
MAETMLVPTWLKFEEFLGEETCVEGPQTPITRIYLFTARSDYLQYLFVRSP